MNPLTINVLFLGEPVYDETVIPDPREGRFNELKDRRVFELSPLEYKELNEFWKYPPGAHRKVIRKVRLDKDGQPYRVFPKNDDGNFVRKVVLNRYYADPAQGWRFAVSQDDAVRLVNLRVEDGVPLYAYAEDDHLSKMRDENEELRKRLVLMEAEKDLKKKKE